ncbi:MAG: hypothetical protein LM586_03360 [Desulfurococcales archaeon]|nr:hypothetical protein [Desulfurococcales archaeon]
MIIYLCRHCGHVIYIYEKIGHDNLGIPTLSDLRYRYQIIRCPHCGKDLEPKKLDPLKDLIITRRGEATKLLTDLSQNQISRT